MKMLFPEERIVHALNRTTSGERARFPELKHEAISSL
jgi:hypothetical protein